MLGDHGNVARLASYKGKRAMYLKLPDRIHDMRTISGHRSLYKQKNIAEETLCFFVTALNHLGLKKMAEELGKLSLAVLSKKQDPFPEAQKP